MRALTLSALLLLSTAALAQPRVLPPPPGRSVPEPHAHAPAPSPTLVVVDRAEWEEKLAKLERLLSHAEDEANRPARKKVQRAREELHEVRGLLARAAQLSTYMPPPAPAPSVYPMTPPELRRLLQAMQRESFGKDQLRVLSEAAPYNHFLVGQVLELLQPFHFPNEKLEAVRMLKPHILDPQESYRLYDAFTFSSDKEKLRRILN